MTNYLDQLSSMLAASAAAQAAPAQEASSPMWLWLQNLGDDAIALVFFGGVALVACIWILCATAIKFRQMQLVHTERLELIRAGESVPDPVATYRELENGREPKERRVDGLRPIRARFRASRKSSPRQRNRTGLKGKRSKPRLVDPLPAVASKSA